LYLGDRARVGLGIDYIGFGLLAVGVDTFWLLRHSRSGDVRARVRDRAQRPASRHGGRLCIERRD
jgi:hypothetical protein